MAIHQPINQPINQSINQSTSQPTNQSINQPTKQSTKQSTNQFHAQVTCLEAQIFEKLRELRWRNISGLVFIHAPKVPHGTLPLCVRSQTDVNAHACQGDMYTNKLASDLLSTDVNDQTHA